MNVTMKHEKMVIPTYTPGEPNELPFFLEKKAYQGATGRVYPIPYTDRLSNTPADKAYDAYTLENEHIRVVLLPELGGKIHGAVDKHNGYEFIYQNTVIKPAMVGLAGPWASGGVEFNWPQHHRPSTFMPLEATAHENPNGSKTVWMGEAEPFHRMRGMVGITVYPGRSYVEAKAVVYNRTDMPLPFMWWNNLAVRVHPRYKATFPPDVEYGNDHDRRAVIPFPVMKGVYHTARPFDYGQGTDVTWFSNVKLPTSVMVSRGQSRMDFLGGYDFEANAGTVTVADHHIASGKKMWTWGDGPFGRAWCNNLTDNGDRYIELMTGVYTDNQPDFTYIMPGETRVFTQVWYPIHTIGEVKNASVEGALSMSVKEGRVSFGALPTACVKGAVVRLALEGAVLYEEKADLSPEKCLMGQAALPESAKESDLCLTLSDGQGRVLVSYQPPVLGKKEPPKARPVAPDPKDIGSLEELYLHGAHLEQYKHHTYDPEDYYREGLRRDGNDLRCNLAIGRLMTEKGDFSAAKVHLEKAVSRLRLRNDNPFDTEAIYLLARLERLEGHVDKAYDLYQQAAWQYAWRSPCYYQIACIDYARGDIKKAKEHLKLCLETNARHFAARSLLGYLERDTSILEAVLADAPQDTFARFCLHLLGRDPLDSFVLGRAEDMTDIALDFLAAGMRQEAEAALRACTAPNQMLLYHLAHLTGEKAAHVSLDRCFPNRLEDIPALQSGEWQASYLLGCLYYDRMNYPAAINAWESALACAPEEPYVLRNLAQAYFDHGNEPDKALACLKRALELAPDNARILYELLQMEKNMGASVSNRLALLEAHQDLARQRDDCFLDFIILYTQAGQYEMARELLLSKRFNIYEGGEGKLTRHHGWLYTLMGHKAHLAGDLQSALKWYQTALAYPDNYGEGRHYSAQEGNIYYYTGLLLEDMGQEKAAREAFENAAGQPGQITEMTYYAALAYQKLGYEIRSRALFAQMAQEGKMRLDSAHRWGYFGVGMAAPLPFELNIRRINSIDAWLLIALGKTGLGEKEEATRAVKELEKLDPWNSKLNFLRDLNVL